MSNRIRNYLPTAGQALGALAGISSLAGLYAISRYNFLIFHCLTEAFSIIIAIAVFTVFWNTRQFLDSDVFLVLGFGCLFGSIFDLVYIFAYRGMSVFPQADGNVALQAKTVAQWYVCFSCLFSLWFLRRKVDRNVAMLVYAATLAIAMASIYWRVFPDCYREGVGQTVFQRLGLVLSCGAYLATLVLLIRRRDEFDAYVLRLLITILIVFFIEDFASALATDINGLGKTVAHMCQVVSLFFVYKAFVEVGLTKPYDLLFRNQQQSEEGLRLVLEASGTGWWRLDLVTQRLTTDDRSKALFGLPPTTEPTVDLFFERVSTEDRARAQRHIAEAAMRPGDYQHDYCTTWPNGSLHWILIKGHAFHDAAGKPLCLEGITMDVTAQRQAHDEQLQRHRAELAQVARLSTMGEMAASLAHEVSQPLHAVHNYARGGIRRLLKMPEMDEELHAALEQIGEEANRAAEIIRRVRVFIGKREPQVSPVSLNSLVEDVVLLNKAEVEQRRAKVVTELGDNLPLVGSDPIQVEQVLMNLVRNGLEAMDETPEDDRVLGIKTSLGVGDVVHVEVWDRGKGIGRDDLERVFEPFFTTKPEGMGMGLAISRSIVQAHGGRLWVSSDDVRSCTFHFTLPVGSRS